MRVLARLPFAILVVRLSVLVSLQSLLALPALGQFLCTAGERDGLECLGDDDCPGGVCVIPLGVCDGGEIDGYFCICPSAICSSDPVCSDDSSLGTCTAGVFEGLCCDTTFNCFDGAPCASTQRICVGGENKAFACLRDDHCPGSLCESTGRFCYGGDFEAFACVDDADCPGSTCMGAAPVPTPTPRPCVGDCNGDGAVTVDELVIGVNLVLGEIPISACTRFDVNVDDRLTIDELIRGVQVLLDGCG